MPIRYIEHFSSWMFLLLALAWMIGAARIRHSASEKYGRLLGAAFLCLNLALFAPLFIDTLADSAARQASLAAMTSVPPGVTWATVTLWILTLGTALAWLVVLLVDRANSELERVADWETEQIVARHGGTSHL